MDLSISLDDEKLAEVVNELGENAVVNGGGKT